MKASSLLKKLLCLVILFSLLAPYESQTVDAAYTFEGKVNATVLNVRSKASTSSSIMGKLKKNHIVTVVSQTKDWSKISYGKKYGWVSSIYLTSVTWTGYVNATSLNLRKSPNNKAVVMDSLKQGSAVTVKGKHGDWLQVYVSSKNKTGWVSSAYVSKKKVTVTPPPAPTKKVTTEPAKTIGTYYVNASALNIRQKASTSAKIIGKLSNGSKVEMIAKEGDWAKIGLASGGTGWVSFAYLTTKNPKANTSETPKSDSVLKGKVIVLDPGHGGNDPGASGSLYREKNLTLSTVIEVGNLLANAGAKVIYTRSNDTYISLAQRVLVSQQNKADAFISIHFNSSTSSNVSGIETYYYSSKDTLLAKSIQSNLIVQTKMKDLSAKFGNYHVLRENKQPAVLVELGFISNPVEEKLIGTPGYQKNAALGIYEGINQYFRER
ncbi:N-acetylmuramoyl-L-alanine amidase [Lederbergia citrea]|uniref:N-acetylmuramoyl-L-alanine amidase n=1 Tax=Lederbergia citrea TaxID=2833581 RepID=A0A942US06_9BACI|nr:N-acetylmuramoyl-L-alanine amidase [Lederbergia citrea]MBS4224567.1 N-acetylmuramoyl-L-alanine amidase [Lederbergia citrea]